MLRALQLAELGKGRVEPNPMVGCLLVHEGKSIGQGYHQQFGGPHAEKLAISEAIAQGHQHRLPESTAYVTLEPCCHHGKTPPCADLLIETGVRRVVVAMQDPFSAVAGRGFEKLRSAGVQVDIGICSSSAQELNAPYVKRLQKCKPWIIVKWAMSLDGRLATRTGNSQWISCQASREVAHELRGRVDAILVGRGTAVADNPLLTARLPDGQLPPRIALRVVLDSNLSIDPNSRLAATARNYPTLIWAGPQADSARQNALRELSCRIEICESQDPNSRLERLLEFLASEYSATNVLVEGGQSLMGSLFDLQQIDECHAFIAPKIIGGQAAFSPIGGLGSTEVSSGPRCYATNRQCCGDDVHFTCRLDWSSSSC